MRGGVVNKPTIIIKPDTIVYRFLIQKTLYDRYPKRRGVKATLKTKRVFTKARNVTEAYENINALYPGWDVSMYYPEYKL